MGPAISYPPAQVDPEIGYRVRNALDGIPGIAEVRLAGSAPRIFIVLEDHDIDRNRRITEQMWDLNLDVEYDLVPARALGMIPTGERIR